MDKVIYKTKIKVWGKDNSKTVTVITDPEHIPSMMHVLTLEEWSIVKMILDSLADSANPVTHILREFGHLGPEDFIK